MARDTLDNGHVANCAPHRIMPWKKYSERRRTNSKLQNRKDSTFMAEWNQTAHHMQLVLSSILDADEKCFKVLRDIGLLIADVSIYHKIKGFVTVTILVYLLP